MIYDDAAGAEKAIAELNESELDGRKIYLRKDMNHVEREKQGIPTSRPRARPLPNPSSTVFVSNLEYSVGWQKIKDVFKVAGRIRDIKMPEEREGKNRGYAVVQFETPTEAYNAITLFHGQMLSDRPMVVRMDSHAPEQPDPMALKLHPTMPPPFVSPTRHAPQPPALPNPLGSLAVVNPLALLSASLTPEQLTVLSNPALLQQAIALSKGLHTGGVLYNGRMESEAPSSPQHIERGDSWERRGTFSSAAAKDGGVSSQQCAETQRGTKLFVKNLCYDTSWQKIKDTFRRAGSVSFVEMFKASDGRPLGCATVTFDNPDDAHKAIGLLNGMILDGREIEVRYDKRDS